MAELFAVGPSLYTFVQLADGLINLAVTLKASVERINENKEKHQQITRNIIRHLKQLKYQSKRLEQSRLVNKEHEKALYRLYNDLNSALRLCQNEDPSRRWRLFNWMQSTRIQTTLTAIDDHVRNCLELFTTGALLRVEASIDAIGRAVSDNNFDMKAQLVTLQTDLERVRQSVDHILIRNQVDGRLLLDSRSGFDAFRTAKARSKKALESLSVALAAHNPHHHVHDRKPSSSHGSTTSEEQPEPQHPKDAILDVIDHLRLLGRERYPSASQLDQLSVALCTIGQVKQARDLSLQAVAHLVGRESPEEYGRIYLNLARHLQATNDDPKRIIRASRNSVHFFRNAGGSSARDGLATALDYQATVILAQKPESSEGLSASSDAVSIRRSLCDRLNTLTANMDYAQVLARHAQRLYRFSPEHPHDFSSEALRASTESLAIYQDIRKDLADHRYSHMWSAYARCLEIHSLCLKDRKKIAMALDAAWEAVEMFSHYTGTSQDSLEAPEEGVESVIQSMTNFVDLVAFARDDRCITERIANLRRVFDALLRNTLPLVECLALAEATRTCAETLFDNARLIGAKCVFDYSRQVYHILYHQSSKENKAQDVMTRINLGQAIATHGLAKCCLTLEPDTATCPLEHSQRALEILWTLPATTTRDSTLANALLTTARCHKILSNTVACIQALEGAVAILQTGADTDPRKSQLASTHHSLSMLYGHDKDTALRHCEEAYNIYHQISALDNSYVPALIGVGCTYSFLLSETGRHDDALTVAKEVEGLSKRIGGGGWVSSWSGGRGENGQKSGLRLRRRATQRLRVCEEQNRRSTARRFSYPFG